MIFLFLGLNLFVIRQIDCLLNSGPCPVEISDKLNRYLNSNVLFLNQKKLISSLKNTSPLEKINIGFKLFNTLSVKIEGRLQPLEVQTSLIATLPQLEMDHFLGSTESATFLQPTKEIAELAKSATFTNFEFWNSGLMTPAASSESKIKYFFTQKPTPTNIKSIYSLYNLVEKYLPIEQYYLLGDRVFLRQASQPDIIVTIPFEEDSLVQVLQSFAYLTTIKKDTKVIDLRFKNPILR